MESTKAIIWKDELRRLMPLLGHRNWILVVDKAYPLQSAAGMTYLNTGEPLANVLSYTLQTIQQSEHIKPVIYTDEELNVLNESFCKGIEKARKTIYETIAANSKEATVQTVLHDKVFAKLDEASKLFNVVVLKTESLFPYTSVFIELDCGYWTAEGEDTLRSLLHK